MKVLAEKSARAVPRAERVRCVVVESGSLLLNEAGSAGFDETIVIAQLYGESPADFAQRFAERLAQLERVGRHLQSAVVLISRSNELEARVARRRIIALFATHARTFGALSELTLMTDRDSGAEHQAELFGLAEAVTALPSAELMPVRVCFSRVSAEEPRRVA